MGKLYGIWTIISVKLLKNILKKMNSKNPEGEQDSGTPAACLTNALSTVSEPRPDLEQSTGGGLRAPRALQEQVGRPARRAASVWPRAEVPRGASQGRPHQALLLREPSVEDSEALPFLGVTCSWQKFLAFLHHLGIFKATLPSLCSFPWPEGPTLESAFNGPLYKPSWFS